MELKIIYEDKNLLVVDKPAGIVIFPEGKIIEKTLIDCLLEKFPNLKNVGNSPRYGVVHRLDKETSGILLVAKDNESLNFLQNQFKERRVTKRYLALAVGNIKEKQGTIRTLIDRAPKNRRKQKAYLSNEPGSEDRREAVTEYKVLERFCAKSGPATDRQAYTLLEVEPETGRKHQIRCHLAHIHHPIACDKLYGFKNQPCPEGLKRQFLHASYLKIRLPGGEVKELKSDLTEDLKNVIKKLYF